MALKIYQILYYVTMSSMFGQLSLVSYFQSSTQVCSVGVRPKCHKTVGV